MKKYFTFKTQGNILWQIYLIGLESF
jgi:hypothetical protein